LTGPVLTPRARRDLGEIWDYSAGQWGTAQADRYVRLITSACTALATGRGKGRSAEAIRPGYFRHTIGSHVLFYRVRKRGDIEIVRSLHQRMDLARHLQ
jgi:toxin ParE1/3/4